jgi:transposase
MPPRLGLPIKPVVIVLDIGPTHVSKAAIAAPAARAHWLTVKWLPKYAPELNDIEPVWRPPDLHRRRRSRPSLQAAVTTLNTERNIRPLVKQRISALL